MREFLENQGTFKFLLISFQSSDFLHAQSCIQLSVIVAKVYLVVYHSVLYGHFEMQFCYETKNLNEAKERFKALQ